ncbi:MAG: cytochrome b/b6 domain-containing protein [Coriobacteriia bacterium]|nr:cytochrome b/b6 domain-containing protein [Coriobacteriia bacterium]MCL2750642.1 cytochrome b/b6 domain-containing protein [Coriobacteriia bacterium]
MAHLAHYRQAHPLPFVISHWVNLLSMLLLIFTGFYIHFPFFEGFMGIARGVHLFCGFVIFLNMVLRVVLAFIVKSAAFGGTRVVDKDYKSFLPQVDNRHQFGAWIKYYLFLKRDHPLGGKFGVLQKTTYVLVPLMILVMFVTGMALWGVTADVGPFAALNDLVGGIMIMRIIHFYLMWAFIIFTFIHVYLATIEGLGPVKLMFFRQESGGLIYDPEQHNIVGEDKMDGDKH